MLKYSIYACMATPRCHVSHADCISIHIESGKQLKTYTLSLYTLSQHAIVTEYVSYGSNLM